MRKRIPKILITGGAGFIGSAFVRMLLKGLSPKGTAPKLIIVDKLTYAGDLKRLEEARGRFKFYKTDICSKIGVGSIFAKEKPDIVVHFAAESHVDRSINDATPFIETNVKGTQILIDASRKYNIKKFIYSKIHVFLRNDLFIADDHSLEREDRSASSYWGGWAQREVISI